MNPLRILLAEDNLGDVLLVKDALVSHKIPHHLHVVRDGDEALAFIEHMGEPDGIPCPDVMLLDLNLPKVDGPEVLAKFRKHPLCAETPVIVITSSGALRDRDRIAKFGIARYFRKPSDLNEFLKLGAVVAEVVEGKAE
jgi:two-component system, chemotaxis family, response regulator Rcp1